MRVRCQRLLVVCLLGIGWEPVSVDAAAPESIPQSLQKYVARPETAFSWKLTGKRTTDAGTVYDIELVSQTWQQIVWKHDLQVFEPPDVQHQRHVLLFVTGGRNGRQPGRDSTQMGLKLARMTGARVALLHQVPNQPLLGGRSEDDLITETWLRFLKTGDESWPLLFPMVKSAVKAMDAIQELARTRWDEAVDAFVITGASKRGWTSWLTPVADRRVVATAPIVIDMLNFSKQMKHQLATWGEFSEQIIDYTSKGLVRKSGKPLSPREVSLWRMMDPFTYRKQLTLPKLLINGTNDRYWVVDATNNYWDDLLGPKFVLQVPNAGHSLRGGREMAYSTLAAFFRHIAGEIPLPRLRWQHRDASDRLELVMTSSTRPQSVRIWTAQSESKDFRDAQWKSKPLTEMNGAYHGRLPKPKHGHVALFGEMQFTIQGLSYRLSTQVRRE